MSNQARKTSQTDQKPRSDKTPEKRPERIPMGLGLNLEVPASVLDKAKAEDVVLRWVIDDKKGMVERRLAAYWEFFTMDGQQFRRSAKNGNDYVLMKLDQVYATEDRDLKRKKNSVRLNEEAKLQTFEGGEEYIPDDRSMVVSSDL